jgi:putative flippase GtrA
MSWVRRRRSAWSRDGRYTIGPCTPPHRPALCQLFAERPLLEGWPVRALRFGAVGIANTALDVALFSFLTLVAGTSAIAANVMSYSAGIGLSFVLNRAWTFHDRLRRRAWTQLILFTVGSLAGLAVSTLVVAVLVGAWGPFPAKAASVIATFAWNYVFANRVVFRQ